jgi:hypothetical protein
MSTATGIPLARLLAIIVAAMVFARLRSHTLTIHPRPTSPASFAASHEWHLLNEAFPPDAAARLVAMVHASGPYRTAAEDDTAGVHTGESVPLGDPACSHPYLAPNRERGQCTMPSRIDVARHFLMTGGRGGYKETYERLVSRVLAPLGYVFDKFDTPDMQLLFNSSTYVEHARDVCQGRTHFDPFQLNLILVLPGQDLPMHWDVPWFWGADRTTMPQWLLVVMEQSGLFASRSVPQIQGVAWLHGGPANLYYANSTGRKAPGEDGGSFFFFPQGPSGPSITVPSAYNHAIVLDGCRVVHGVDRYRPDADLPVLKKTDRTELDHVGGGVWHLKVNGTVIREYRSEDLRISLAWRARCFRDADEQKRWKSAEKLSVATVLDTLEADLRVRGVLKPSEPRPAPIDFAVMLLKEYARYPIDNGSKAWIPYNYCMAERYLPSILRPLFTPFCTTA